MRTFRTPLLALALVCLATAPLTANSLSVTSAAAMDPASVAQNSCAGDGQAGPCGLEIQLTDTANAFLTAVHPDAEPYVRMTFWLDPATINLDPGENVKIFKAFNSQASGREHLVGRVKLTGNGNTYKFVLYQKQNGGFRRLVGRVVIRTVSTVRDRKFDIEWLQADAGPNPQNGTIRIFRDDVMMVEETDFNTSTMDIDEIRVGVFGPGPTAPGATGEIHFDEFRIERITP